jgi:hypothetical protein
MYLKKLLVPESGYCLTITGSELGKLQLSDPEDSQSRPIEYKV